MVKRRQTSDSIHVYLKTIIFFHLYCDSSLQPSSYMIFVLVPQNTITKVTLLYARLPFYVHFYVMYWCHF